MNRVLLICPVILIFAGVSLGQKSKPWTEWTEKEAAKILNESAWGQTQSESANSSSQPSQTSAITATTASRREDSSITAAKNVESGEKKDVPTVHYRIRWLSAKPIRAAFVRMIELQGAPADRVAQLRTFVDRDFGEFVVLTLTLDGSDRKRMIAATQVLTDAEINALKPITYLERKDGKRVELMDYRAPTQDGLGAKFVFPRMVDGSPLIDANTGEVKFTTELGKTKIIRRFKVADMMYEGKLEY